jgi:ribonuclease J
LLIKPNITTRGFILVNENQELIKEIENKVAEIVNEVLSKRHTITDLKNQIIFDLNIFINQKTGRRPIILPVIMDVKRDA